MKYFAICIDNNSNPASLILGKVYPVLPDVEAKMHNMVRILDEDKSEPDGYLYEAAMFVPIELPEMAKQALVQGQGADLRTGSRPKVGTASLRLLESISS